MAWSFIAMFEKLKKSMLHMVYLNLGILKGWLKDRILLGKTTRRTSLYRLCLSIKNAHFKEFLILILQYNNSLQAPWKRFAKIEPKVKHESIES